MNILLDCDDVLLDWIGGFWDYCEYTRGLQLDNRGPLNWDMSVWLNTTSAEAVKLVREFNSSDHFQRLKPTIGAMTFVHKWSKTHELHVITSCSSDPVVKALRQSNLDEVFGDVFASVTCLDLGTPKKEVLSKYAPSVWIEDSPNNAFMGAACGHHSFVRRVQHNRNAEVNNFGGGELEWFTEWYEVDEALILEGYLDTSTAETSRQLSKDS